MKSEPEEATDATEQTKKPRKTDAERATEMEEKAKSIRRNAQLREARLKDKKIPKIEQAIVLIELRCEDRLPADVVVGLEVACNALLEWRDELVTAAVPK